MIRPPKRRTTLSLPSEMLDQAERIALAENVTLNTVLTRALANSLPQLPSPEKARQLLESYRKAFEIPGFSEEQLLLLDGIVLEPVSPEVPQHHE